MTHKMGHQQSTRVVHKWNRDPRKTAFKTVCGIGVLAIVKAEVASDVHPVLPRGGRWCHKCERARRRK